MRIDFRETRIFDTMLVMPSDLVRGLAGDTYSAGKRKLYDGAGHN